jgi:hypothetical protein
MRKIFFSFGLVMIVILLSSCMFETACTAIFSIVTLRVEDEIGQSVNGVKVTVTLERTDEILAMGRELDSGSYVIADDSLKGKFSENGDVLGVVGSKDGKGFQTQFKIRSGICNIEKISGPEVVVLQ